jgi:hypothetical protein
MSGGTMKTKLPDLELLDADFICFGTQPVFGVLWIPGRQTKKIPYLYFKTLVMGMALCTSYFTGTWFKFWSKDWSQQHSFFSWFSSVPPMKMLGH